MQHAREGEREAGGGRRKSPGVLLSQGHTEERRACSCTAVLVCFEREKHKHKVKQEG